MKYTEIKTRAQAVEQPPPGLALMHAARIRTDAERVRVSVGGAFGANATPGCGDDGAALYQGNMAGGHLAAAIADDLEVGGVARVAVGHGQSEASAPARPAGDALEQYGVRLRGSPGGERLSVGLGLEMGLRQVNLAHGVSVACDVRPFGEGWVPTDPTGACFSHRGLQGKAFSTWDFYANATAYPTIRLGDAVYLYLGGGLDTVTTGHLRDEVVSITAGGVEGSEEDDETYKSQLVVLALAGLDACLADHVGLLLNVEVPFGEAQHPGPVVEGAISVGF